MTTKPIASTVTPSADGTYVFVCPSPTGCGGNPSDPSSRFVSAGWPTADLAEARGAQHITEHLTAEAMPSLEAFRAEHGLTVTPTGQVVDLATYLTDSKES